MYWFLVLFLCLFKIIARQHIKLTGFFLSYYIFLSFSIVSVSVIKLSSDNYLSCPLVLVVDMSALINYTILDISDHGTIPLFSVICMS
jgi:hypothetical protein